jgi:hypothetical protein
MGKTPNNFFAMILYLWWARRHYPLLQNYPHPRIEHNVETDDNITNMGNIHEYLKNDAQPFEILDFCKRLQNSIFFEIYLFNRVQNELCINYIDKKFSKFRDSVWKVIHVSKLTFPVSECYSRPPNETPAYTNKKGLVYGPPFKNIPNSSYNYDELVQTRNLQPWIHTGYICSFPQKLRETCTVFDTLVHTIIPKGCSISASTNSLLSTILWGTKRMVLTIPQLSIIILKIYVLMRDDGGHSLVEVLAAIWIIAFFYKVFFRSDVHLNQNTIENLYDLMCMITPMIPNTDYSVNLDSFESLWRVIQDYRNFNEEDYIQKVENILKVWNTIYVYNESYVKDKKGIRAMESLSMKNYKDDIDGIKKLYNVWITYFQNIIIHDLKTLDDIFDHYNIMLVD